ncbi:SDR family oxidoreductase [Dactylosporangium aurantiacum]|uniref:SDR family oxidoreductase n=1 Tax=Dactylosporangium aurantiacum TaxID=35754 RepID=A0A9Q9II55_9ACTN|nr:SDR family oxidoreductase [Dactylosporangium aurantiacum]MDG6102681.1 SDR family oxidoreductase [Dactylosporangium aurantiacum]UWZ53070.1 SDR family oxidoreductase [Dactylosporangium aurantiacum]
MQQSLTGQVVLITGAARGIGEHTARLAAARGAKVVLVGLEPDRLAALAAELGGAAWFLCDVTDQASLTAAVDGAVAAHGRIDAVVANAGVASRGTVATGDVEALVRTVEVNLIGVLRTAAAVMPHLIASRGYLLIVASAASFAALPGMVPYCASKAGVEHLGNALRLEVAHHGVRVGTAHPSWIDTDLVRDAQDDMPTFRETLRKLPPPLGSTTSVQRCAEAFVDAVQRRRRKVFVPRSVAVVYWLRTFFGSRLAERVVERQARTSVPAMEEQVRTLRRGFGAHTAVGLPVPGEAPSPGFIADRYHR